MFETVLVAGRGVTALRVLRTCDRLGVQAVAVHADDDARAPHVRAADDAIPLGGPSSEETYRDTRKLLEAARRSGAQALHPGDGPVAHDPAFAEEVAEAGLVWLGPPAQALARPPEPVPDGARRVVVTVLRDGAQGQVLGRRERFGSLLDVEPAAEPADPLEQAALAFADAVGLLGPWGVEVALGADGPVAVGLVPLLAPGSSATAAVAGLDLVELQLRLASGERAAAPASGPGCAVALQVRAADRFAGRLRRLRVPTGDGVRSDAGAAEGDRVTARSDRLLAVVTVPGPDRGTALARARTVLDAVEVSGVPTSVPLLRALLDDPSLAAGAPGPDLTERIRRS